MTVEILQGRHTEVGGLPVHRSLPTHGRRSIGAWCFLDHFGPVAVNAQRAMQVGPHPHIGLHTVTWLLDGEALHSDSLGNRQMIRPGQLNLMTAGHGIAHAEDGRSQEAGVMEGIQFWVAQPEATRHGSPDFAHHHELPTVSIARSHITVLLGALGDATSPARTDSPLIGLEIVGQEGLDIPAVPRFEYGVAVLRGGVRSGEVTAGPNELAYFGSGHDELHLELAPDSRLILLGGEPLTEDVFMWWNFVGRERHEMEQARSDWQDHAERFGPVDTSLTRIEAPVPFWLPGPP